MKPELIVIRDTADIEKLQEYLADKEFIAIDCETTGLSRRDEVIGLSVCAEEDKAYYIIIKEWDTKLNILYPGRFRSSTYIKNLLVSLMGKNLVGHNSVFDCMMLYANFNVSLIEYIHTDTMILAHLLDENRRVGLKDLASSMFGEDSIDEQKEMKQSVLDNGGKLTKNCYEMYKADSMLLGKYGAKDAWLTYKLFMELVPQLYDQGLDEFFYYDESMPLLRGPTYELNTVGLQVDTAALTTLKKTLEAECLEAKDFIYHEIANLIKDKYSVASKFNIGSSQQLSWLLFGKLGLEFSTLTKGGKTLCKSMGLKLPYTYAAKKDFIHEVTQRGADMVAASPAGKVNGKVIKAKKIKEPWAYIACDKTTLKKFAPKLKWVEKLLEYQKKMKILSTYVEGIEERTNYGTIQPGFLQHGTTSGRYSSRNPNFQNLPRDDKRIKSCIKSRGGKSFVGADYSQLEPRVFAYFSKDERLLSAFTGADDFYSVIGMEVYNKSDCIPRKEGSPDAFGVKYKKLRDLSKVIALASTYGATAHQLSPTTGKNIEDTQQDIDNYFERFPGVAQMMLDSHEKAKKSGMVFNYFGRPRRIPDAKKINKIYGNVPHSKLPYEARKLLNLSVNHVIQSTGASIVNRAAIRFHENCKKAGLNAQIVCQVHDSLIVECKDEDADSVAILLRDAMENTVELEGIRLEAIPKIGKTLADV
jgi:DNA polymerase-1